MVVEGRRRRASAWPRERNLLVSSSSSPSGRSFPAEPALALASTRCGSLIAAGHASGAASLWDSTGRLLRCWPAHYKRTAALTFSGDGAWLLSGGGDGGVSLWDIADVCDGGAGGSSSAAPFRAWPSAHTLPVTCVAAGAGRVGPLAASASLDYSVVLFAATAGTMLRRVQLGSPCRCLCLEGGEHSLYVGCEDGNIFEVDLVGRGEGENGGNSAKRRDGGGSGDDSIVLPPGVAAVLSGHGGAVTCLASPSSANSSLLVSGSEDGTVRVWDAASRATLRLLKHAAATTATGRQSELQLVFFAAAASPVVAVAALPVGVGPGARSRSPPPPRRPSPGPGGAPRAVGERVRSADRPRGRSRGSRRSPLRGSRAPVSPRAQREFVAAPRCCRCCR